ncbi:MAG: class II aldolase/adducin family protein [Candidatus Diapherotrites archaeon]
MGKKSKSAAGKSVAKFATIFLERRVKDAPIYTKQINELIGIGRGFAKAGLLESEREVNAGNLSFRTRAGMVITASGADLAKLKKGDFIEVLDWGSAKAGDFVFARGAKEPSSESVMHFEIYRARKDVKFIFHGHSGKILKRAKALGLACTKRQKPFGTPELAWEALDVLGAEIGNGGGKTKTDFAVMKGHGFLALGKTAKQAGECALKVQKLAENAAKSGRKVRGKR